MLIDGRRLPAGEILDADLCVIGAGAAGITIARALAGSGVKICLVESGGFDYEDDVQAFYDGEVVGLPYAIDAETRLRFFGGSTNHWGGLCRRFDPFALAKREWVPHSGWPFGIEELERYYPKAAEWVEIGPLEPDPAVWAERLGRRPLPFGPDSALFNAPFQISPPTRFGERYRDDLLDAGNITLCLNGNLMELVAHGDGHLVERARFKTLNGVAFTVRAKHYVLACGGIENARLLLLSNSVERPGLGNRHDLVGRFFMEHGHFHLGWLLLGANEADPSLYVEQSETGGQMVTFHVSLSPAAQKREQVAYASIQLRPGLPSPGEHAVRKIWAEAAKGRWPDDLATHLKTVIDDIGPVSSWIGGKLAHELLGTARYGERLGIRSEAEQVPDPDNRVTLGVETDALGLPRVRLAWRLNDLDRRTLNRMRMVMATEVGRLGLGRVQIADDDGEPAFIQPGYHHIGTTRMADDASQGVVDRNGRVHGVENLFVAGSSVFPTSGDVTPTLTIVALALRLADHLRSRVFA